MSESEPAKYCIKCESVMLLKTNNTTGKAFYSCSNWPGCKFTQSVKSEPEAQAPINDSDSPEARAANQIKENAVQQANEYLETLALQLKSIGPAMEVLAMAAAIPGFGKMAEELTDEERKLRADYFTDRTRNILISQPLPYNQKEWLTENPNGG